MENEEEAFYLRFKAHGTRVKTIKGLKNLEEILIVSGCSDGKIKIWNLFSMIVGKNI